MAPPNPTGFDMKTFKAAASPTSEWALRDPWKRQFKTGFPGLGIATVAFAIYCGYEYAFLNDNHHGHKEEGHH
ncbi:NADH-ubiquinone oxidoreductase B12 subunit [Trichophyton tonsurans CBS 112818]|uniref:NADH-ubiquinone oxidoreductase B12 subunit n=2 Tax=Trichophyton TaxID=5550 RepID=F2PQ47_TRIEC|nr:NADH-ubiquinone oxidoreductase B12 subunit [Trichophyton tonsurans CBS 112818]EGE04015.1 NADH-ubiquinone oxidoreductase B12 subunit [Trichophyton equinum CBS 127.97]